MSRKKKLRRMRRIKWERRKAAELADANESLHDELRRTQQECSELRDACANLVIERDAADAALDLLGRQTR